MWLQVKIDQDETGTIADRAGVVVGTVWAEAGGWKAFSTQTPLTGLAGPYSLAELRAALHNLTGITPVLIMG